MTREQLQEIWRKSPTREDFVLRVFGVRDVSEEELTAFLVANGCVKPADDPDYVYPGGSVKPTEKEQRVVERWIVSPSPDGVGFTKRLVAGTEKQLAKLQHDENDRATAMGVQGLAGALARTGQNRGQGARPVDTREPGRAEGRTSGADVRPAPARPPVPGSKPATTTGPRTPAAGPPAPAATTGPPPPGSTRSHPPPATAAPPTSPRPASSTPPPKADPAAGTPKPTAGGSPTTPGAGGSPPSPAAGGPQPPAAANGPARPRRPRVRNSDLPDFVPEPPPQRRAPAGGIVAAGMTADQLAEQVRAARDYYRGHQGEVGTVLAAGREPMYVKSGEEGGPWGGTQRGGTARGTGEAYTSGKAHEKNIASHVEGHVANIMREQGIARATLVMGVDQCQICARSLPTVLPRGTTLEVVHVSPSGAVDTNTYSSSR